MSVVTKEMVEAFAKHFSVELDAAEGSLAMWERGEGEMDATLTDAEATRELFAPLRTAYFTAKGVEEPALSQVDTPVVEEGLTSEVETKE